jgi:hypothetical protein
MKSRVLSAALVAGGLALAGGVAAVGDAPESAAAADYAIGSIYYGVAQGSQTQQQMSAFVCGFSGAASWAPFDPTTMAFYGTNFCAGPAELELVSIQAFVHDADTDAVVAEAPLASSDGTDATAVLSNGGLVDVERPRSFYIHLEVATTLTEESGQVWGSAPAECEGLGTRELTCSWDGPPFFV